MPQFLILLAAGAGVFLVRRWYKEEQRRIAAELARARKAMDQQEAELRRAVRLAALPTEPGDAIVVVLDADEDCAAELGPRLNAWAQFDLVAASVAPSFARFSRELRRLLEAQQ